MGLMDFLKKALIDVIEWTEPAAGILIYQFPMEDREIQNGAHLTVKDTQLALFVNEGKLADLLVPGRHALNTQNLPVLSKLRKWDRLFASSFKCELYFFSTMEQIDQRWSTQKPIMLRDKEFGAIPLQGQGSFAYKIKDARIFYQKISGPRAVYNSSELEAQLQALILSELSSYFGALQIAFNELAAEQGRFSKSLQDILKPSFAQYGLVLSKFLIQSLILPEELQKHLDKPSSMPTLTDLRRYVQFQSLDSKASEDSK